MKFLGQVTEDPTDKVKNVFMAFAIYTLYFIVFTQFMEWLWTGQMFFKEPSFKYRFFFSCVWAPIFEEAMFRVVPIQIAKRVDEKLICPVILLSSMIFGWMHGSPVNILVQGVMGFILSCLYLKNNCSYSSVVALHSLWNMACIFILERLN